LYADHGKEITDAAEVKKCSALGECGNCKAGSWGACYVKDKTGVPAHLQCLCVPTTNKFWIKAFLKQGCPTKQIMGKQKAYDGLCALDSFAIPRAGKSLAPVKAVTSTPANCIKAKKGQKLQCKNRNGAWKVCTAMVVGQGGRRVKVHFEGFAKRFDKYMDLCSGDVRA